jgi:Fe-only nitrogenase accessory protein AnfO
MQIAIHLDAAGQPASLNTAGVLCLYEGSGAEWALLEEWPLALPREGGIPAVRAAVEKMVFALAPCTVLISAEVRGYVYSLLQEQHGFSVWKSHGPVAAMLASVCAGEEERLAKLAEAAACCDTIPEGGCGSCGSGRATPISPPPEVVPEDRPDGSRFVDLAAALAADLRHNSRSVLGPILLATPFRPLTIRMDHQPRWLAGTLRQTGLGITEGRRDGGVFVTVTAEEALVA